MKRVTLFEHQRLYRGGSKAGENDAQIDPALYDRLRHFDFYHREKNQRVRERKQKDRVFDWGYGYAKAKQWVGVVQVPGLQVEILPKAGANEAITSELAASNLLYMLSVAGMIPLRERDLADVSLTRTSLMEALAAIFAKRLAAQLSRGLERSYQSIEANIRTFKGKLLVTQHVRANAAHRERMYCSFDEYSADTAMNRIFKACCNLLHRTTRKSSTQKALRVSLELLDDVSDVIPSNHVLDSIILNRQNERFADLLTFCRLILAQNSPTGHGGMTRTFALLFDMNVVFERFIGASIKRWVLPAIAKDGIHLKAHLQAKGMQLSLVRNTETQRNEMRLAPDVLLTDPEGAAHLILDTKWKRPDKSRPSQSDIYQLFAYAHRYQSPRNVLLYPCAEGSVPRSYELLKSDHGTRQTLDSCFVDLDRDLRKDFNKIICSLKAIVQESQAASAAPCGSERSSGI